MNYSNSNNEKCNQNNSKNDKFFDTEHFSLIAKKLVISGILAKFPKASQAILPVILMHCDRKGTCYPSQKTIADLAGIDVKTVREGIKGLEDVLPKTQFFVKNKPTPNGYLHKHYFFQQPKITDNNPVFYFYDFVIKSKIWSLLTSSAKALYVVLRTFAHFPSFAEVAERDEEFAQLDWQNPENQITIYQNREYDVFDYEPEIYCEYAGIDITSLQSAVDSLSSQKLIDYFDESEMKYKIYLRSEPNEQGYYFPPSALTPEIKTKANLKNYYNTFGKFKQP